MFTSVATVLVFAGLILTSVAMSIRHNIRRISLSPEAKEDSKSAAELVRCLPDEYKELLQGEGFRFTKAYSFHSTKLADWMRISAEPPLRYFSLIRSPGHRAFEFITQFSDHTTLTTTTSRSAFALPRPFGSFLQSFPNAKPEALSRLHREGERFLRTQLNIHIEECSLPTLEIYRRHTVRAVSHIMSLRCWVLRAVYWYLVKRWFLHNRPIWAQKISQIYGTPS
jgi:hypothetical protein